MQRSGEKRTLNVTTNEESQPDRKRPALASVIVEALKVDSLQKLCSSLEPILRRVVSEEVERALAKLGPAKLNARVSPNRIEGPDGRNLQLQFRSKLSMPLFTGGKVEGERGSAIHIVLLDGNTGHVVTSGPESAVKLDVVVLGGDFNNEDDDGWTREEFESHIVKEREGKRPLLTGDLQVILKDGVGSLGELTFTDNSSWIRSRKFRLGLKVVSGSREGMHIREAKTEAFSVKDHRGELYKKHYPPALNDDVWRLEKIGKDGSFHKRLNKSGIHTVEDFLRLIVRDSQRLRNILGSGMSNKMWDALVEHAKTCVPSGKLHVYYPDDMRSVGVVFSNIYELCGLIYGGQFHSVDSLSENQKEYVDTLVKKAYDNWMNVVEYDGESLLSLNQNQTSDDPQNHSNSFDLTTGSQNHSSSFDHQLNLPNFPASVSSEQPAMDQGRNIGGYNDSRTGSHTIQSQNTNLSVNEQLNGAPFPHQNHHFVGTSQQTQPSGSGSIQTLRPPESSFSSFFAASTPNPSYKGADDFFTDQEIRMRSHEMLENEDMQHLLRIFNMGGQNHASSSSTQDNYQYGSSYMPSISSTYGFQEDRTRSGKGVVGWLKLKAALRWGIFIRKEAADKRAQIVELDDT